MAKKPPKETPHLRVRIDPKLLAKLEKSRERNDRTLTGEIVARLEQSFQADEHMALFREAMEKRVEDNRRRMHEEVAAYRKQAEEDAWATYERARQDAEQHFAAAQREFERTGAELTRAAAVVDVLLGGSKLKSDIFRSLALELADLAEDWLMDESNRRQLVERAVAGMVRRTGAAAQ